MKVSVKAAGVVTRSWVWTAAVVLLLRLSSGQAFWMVKAFGGKDAKATDVWASIANAITSAYGDAMPALVLITVLAAVLAGALARSGHGDKLSDAKAYLLGAVALCFAIPFAA